MKFENIEWESSLTTSKEILNKVKKQQQNGSELIHYITHDKQLRSSKPEGSENCKIQYDLIYRETVTIEELHEVTIDGITWSPAIFAGRPSNENWRAQSIFALDFDSGIPIEEVIPKFEEYSLSPNLFYYSFSSTVDHPRYRLIFFFDKVVTDINQRNRIQNALIDIGEDADKQCRDAKRIFYGGTEGKILTRELNQILRVNEYIELTTITRKGRMRDVSEKIEDFAVSNDSPINKSKSNISEERRSWFEKHTEIRKNRDLDIQKAIDRINILKDFDEGEWLHHEQLYGLALNLYWIRGGFRYMVDTMEKYDEEKETDYKGLKTGKNKYSILKLIRKKNKNIEGDFYKPQKLSEFSPYPEDHKYHNILEAILEPVGYMKKLDQSPKMPLEKAEKYFDEKFNEAIEADNKKLYLFNLPTGIGKTEKLTTLEGVTICATTHSLKEEIHERMKVRSSITPELPDFDEVEHNNKIRTYYRAGLNRKVYGYIKMLIMKDSIIDFHKATTYLESMSSCYSSSNTIITTHFRGVYTNFEKHNTLIFDEDPFQGIIQIKNFSIPDLNNIIDRLEIKKEDPETIVFLKDYRETLMNMERGEVQKAPDLDIDKDAVIDAVVESGVRTNFVDFLNAQSLQLDFKNKNQVHYLVKNDLPDKKILIMSATTPVEMYKLLFPDKDIEVVDLNSCVELKGSIKQFTAKSYSRQSLSNSIEEVNEKLDDNPTITFKEFIPRINNARGDIYFGNLVGYDDLKGEDLNIVGTYHLNNTVYILYAHTLGIEFSKSDLTMDYQMIEWGGYRFRFNTYPHEKLRDIQLSLIQSEAIQAVGRARALREDVTIKCYTNIPVPNAEIIMN